MPIDIEVMSLYPFTDNSELKSQANAKADEADGVAGTLEEKSRDEPPGRG